MFRNNSLKVASSNRSGNTNKSFLHGEWFDRIAKTDGNITK